MTMLTVVRAGWASTIQDHGRPGHAHLGVPRSGAADRDQLARLNRLVGNEPDAAGIETAGGLVLRAGGPAVVATSTEPVAHSIAAGDVVEVDPSAGDLFGYLAVRGAIAVEPVLGSRSHDTLSGLGPSPLADGDELPVGRDPGTMLVSEPAPQRPRPARVAVWPGPRQDWLAPEAFEQLVATTWSVSGDVSRVGARLDGPRLGHRRDEQLPSEGLVLGAIQVPPDGRPVVMLSDHPTTGGYPVLAVVDPTDVAVVAQARPGATLRFRRP